MLKLTNSPNKKKKKKKKKKKNQKTPKTPKTNKKQKTSKPKKKKKINNNKETKHQHGANLSPVIQRNRPIPVAFFQSHGDVTEDIF